jgi:hypothetical protein
MLSDGLGARGNFHLERRSLAYRRLDPDATTMHFHDLLGDSETEILMPLDTLRNRCCDLTRMISHGIGPVIVNHNGHERWEGTNRDEDPDRSVCGALFRHGGHRALAEQGFAAGFPRAQRCGESDRSQQDQHHGYADRTAHRASECGSDDRRKASAQRCGGLESE